MREDIIRQEGANINNLKHTVMSLISYYPYLFTISSLLEGDRLARAKVKELQQEYAKTYDYPRKKKKRVRKQLIKEYEIAQFNSLFCSTKLF